jgi:hypothetical protein
MPILSGMPSTGSTVWLCTSKIRLIAFGESSRTPSTSPPQVTADWGRATDRALPWPLVAPMSAHRQRSVQRCSMFKSRTGPVKVLNAGPSGSSWLRSIGCGGHGTRLATRWKSDGGRPMWKSSPSGPAICAARNSPRRWPVMRRITSPIRCRGDRDAVPGGAVRAAVDLPAAVVGAVARGVAAAGGAAAGVLVVRKGALLESGSGCPDPNGRWSEERRSAMVKRATGGATEAETSRR